MRMFYNKPLLTKAVDFYNSTNPTPTAIDGPPHTFAE